MTGIFDSLNSIFYLLGFLVLVNVIFLAVRSKISSFIYISFNTVVLAIVSIILFFKASSLTDDLNMDGSSLPFYLTIFIGILAVIAIPLGLKNKKAKNS